MADPRSRLQVVEEIDEPPLPPIQKPDPLVNLGAQALMVGLGALSKRFVVALASLWLGCFTISTVFSAFWLWYSVAATPTNLQLVALATYAIFVLAANVIVRRV